MSTIHLSFSPFINSWFFYTGSLDNQFSSLFISFIGYCIKKGVFHFFISIFLLDYSQSFLRKYTLMKRVIYDLQLLPNWLKTNNKGVHIKLFSTFLSFSHNGVKYLAFAQRLEKYCLFDVNLFEMKQIFMVFLSNWHSQSVLHDIVLNLLEYVIDNTACLFPRMIK